MLFGKFWELKDELKQKPKVIKMYSMHNEENPVSAERFKRILKNKIYIYMGWISKNVYIDSLDDIVNKYKTTNHSTIKVKTVDVKPSIYIDFCNEINDKNPKLKIGNIISV